ncbi:carboxymuconolactone decarboxylase family protein [Microbacterium sp. YMB-B2]|uniref:Carboxymuconolactone decarboxylase family protein n=1 Tax=Microbacterium tenebrionis TaxID=2830665 RepID=A0A9X1LQJ7_9MICO|nr:carboxymuconolactone decarboxylase family protein [Microbacterium tenebrionis]MCC2030055.1 carboxymuconolactone decarboxylase family protein [Microbacterium tenebrionis]
MDLTSRQQEIKDRFMAERGEWSDAWEAVLQIDPDFVSASLDMLQVPYTKNHLSAKFKELCYLSWNAAATHGNLNGARTHMRRALALGATPHEIVEVLQLASTLGIHTMNIGVPLLVEVLEERGRTGPAPLTAAQEELKRQFTETRGYWHDFWNEMLELDPEMFAAYTEFSSVPWRTGVLTPAEKELIYISYDIAATHLYVPGTKLHIRNALNHGATVEQVIEVMEISSVLGLDAMASGIPILLEELRAAGRPLDADA